VGILRESALKVLVGEIEGKDPEEVPRVSARTAVVLVNFFGHLETERVIYYAPFPWLLSSERRPAICRAVFSCNGKRGSRNIDSSVPLPENQGKKSGQLYQRRSGVT